MFQIEPVGQPFYQVGSEILNVGQNKLSRGSLLYVKPKGVSCGIFQNKCIKIERMVNTDEELILSLYCMVLLNGRSY